MGRWVVPVKVADSTVMAEMVGLAASEAYPAAAPVPAVMTASSEVRVYAVARGSRQPDQRASRSLSLTLSKNDGDSPTA